MIDLQDWIGPDAIRAIQFSIFEDDHKAYLRSGPFGDQDRRAVEQRIRNVPNRRLRRIVEAVPPFDLEDLPSAWSHFMAVAAGTHPWPDANHRTGFLAFDLALRHAATRSVHLPPTAAEDLVRRSKAQRDPDYRRRRRYYAVRELRSPEHPYRRLMASFEPALEIRRL